MIGLARGVQASPASGRDTDLEFVQRRPRGIGRGMQILSWCSGATVNLNKAHLQSGNKRYRTRLLHAQKLHFLDHSS